MRPPGRSPVPPGTNPSYPGRWRMMPARPLVADVLEKFLDRTSLAALLAACIASGPVAADTLRVAVASNFHGAARQLGEAYAARSAHDVHFSAGATGALYAQLTRGAPFEIFMAADAERPRLLEAGGHTAPDSRSTYALGRIVLWSGGGAAAEVAAGAAWWADADGVCREGVLRDDGRVAMANPRLAPYGIAAKEAIARLGWDEALSPRLVTGANIAQAFHMTVTGNARFGFVALSQLADGRRPGRCRWLLPQTLHAPITQQLVVMRGAPPAAHEFAEFVLGEAGRRIVARAGYGLPDAS